MTYDEAKTNLLGSMVFVEGISKEVFTNKPLMEKLIETRRKQIEAGF